MEILKNKRFILFKKYASNLSLLKANGLLPHITPKYPETYICPICLTHFSQEEGLNTSAENYLTFEDVPPVSLGGRANILTCKKCNNTCGYQIDVHLAERMKEWDNRQFLPGTEAEVKVEYKDKTIQTSIKVKEGGVIEAMNSIKNNNPVTLKEYIESISAPDNPVINIKFLPTRVNPERLHIALLKIGYLMTFEKYGYAFILDPMYDRIRQQLLKPTEIIYPSDFWYHGPFSLEHKGVPVSVERGLECLMPTFALSTKSSTRAFITIIPLTSIHIEETIAAFRKQFKETPQFTMAMEALNYNYLIDIQAIKQLLQWIVNIKARDARGKMS